MHVQVGRTSLDPVCVAQCPFKTSCSRFPDSVCFMLSFSLLNILSSKRGVRKWGLPLNHPAISSYWVPLHRPRFFCNLSTQPLLLIERQEQERSGKKWPSQNPAKNRSCGVRPQKPTSFCGKTPCFTCERWNVPDVCSKNTGLSTLRPGLLRWFSVQVMDFVGDTKK